MHEYSFVRIEGSLINELYAVAFLGKISITMQELMIFIIIRKEQNQEFFGYNPNYTICSSYSILTIHIDMIFVSIALHKIVGKIRFNGIQRGNKILNCKILSSIAIVIIYHSYNSFIFLIKYLYYQSTFRRMHFKT